MKEKQHVHVLLCLYMLMRDEDGRKKDASMYSALSCGHHFAQVICSVANAPVLISDITPGLGMSIQLVYTCTCTCTYAGQVLLWPGKELEPRGLLFYLCTSGPMSV